MRNAIALSSAAVAAIALGTATAGAETVAYWNFEDGTAGAEFTPAGSEPGTGGSADVVTGTLARGYDVAYGAEYTDQTPPLGDDLAMNLVIGGDGAEDVTSDAYITEGPLFNWSPSAWTIETSVYLRNIDGFRTMIGRDGSSQAEPESDFYLANNGIDNQFRINYDTVGGQRWVLDGQPEGGVQADTWYGVAARSDGATLELLIDDGSGFEVVSSLDISAQTAADNALIPAEFNWTLGRGWYNGGFVDHVDGIMDNVRFSDEAVATGDLLAIGAVVPEPTTAGLLLALGGLGLARRRR